ncbi:UPF0175 family protein [Alicyclobacillus cycloheptanicus]|uniref:HTH domain antitoxin n=1 Tax=Alicyclobacillus cycloheptanicus TaxID=1457 RepID=A0ABT9XMS7_9BACL|nr:UPF0175 family protein [Alicyclobacillus cycloheptanicus]MDQ0191593.1 putative HTH domain antitoxin [Alicyclobacillus cycloheptanicus]WDM02239.1 UPF0175 family protein [Alicyclobacillus cycloheptanicus]
MLMSTNNQVFRLTLPIKFKPYLVGPDDDPSKARVTIAIGLMTMKRLPLDQAARLAGKTPQEFVEMLQEENIPWAEYAEED